MDSKLPRSKALVHAALPAVAFLAGGMPAAIILAVTALLMGAGVIGGPRYSLIGRTVKAVRSAVGAAPGKPDAAGPHRFAEAVGAVMVGLAAVLYAGSADTAGSIVSLGVAGLAALNAFAGICVGCQMYLFGHKARARLFRRQAWS